MVVAEGVVVVVAKEVVVVVAERVVVVVVADGVVVVVAGGVVVVVAGGVVVVVVLVTWGLGKYEYSVFGEGFGDIKCDGGEVALICGKCVVVGVLL